MKGKLITKGSMHMQNNFWKKLDEKFHKIHFEDTEIHTKGETVYVNPTVKLLIGWGIFLIAFLLFVIIGKPFGNKPAEEPVQDVKTDTEENLGYTPFERNMYPEVNMIVESYLNAITSEDLNVLSTMVVDSTPYSVEWLQQRKQFVVSYSNIDCYTKPGLTEGSYVVYAVVNTQIPEVEVQPLSMHQFYLIPNEYGGFLLDNTVATNPDIQAYLTQIEQDEDVIALYESVNQNNRESAAQDETLRAFYERIGQTQ